jgi:hypothetical protein
MFVYARCECKKPTYLDQLTLFSELERSLGHVRPDLLQIQHWADTSYRLNARDWSVAPTMKENGCSVTGTVGVVRTYDVNADAVFLSTQTASSGSLKVCGA